MENPLLRVREQNTSRRMRYLLRVFGSVVGLFGVLASCGGQTIEPLDARDATLPEETRRWIAAVEDGVVVARARLEAAKDRLARVEQRRDQREEQMRFGGRGEALERALDRLSEAQVELASLRVDHAAAVLDLARAKYRLANAERAILHDLARYDLEPLREELEEVRRRLREARQAVRIQSEAAEKATTEWWKAYAGFVAKKGDTRPFWTGIASPLRVADAKPEQPAAEKPASAPSRSHVGGEEIPQNPFQ